MPTVLLDPRAGSLFNISAGAGSAQQSENRNANQLFAAIGSGAALFGIQFLVFYLLRDKLTRIYRPKTYLVPEKDRTKPPPSGFFRWAVPVFKTSNAELISKCGLDAYFFLRYLRMLLKIFVPAAVVILAVLLPINTKYTGNSGVSGLDRLGWQNFDPAHTDRFWAHLVLAVLELFWACYVIFDELSGYIRVRQAYLTSPQHRLRASATTVLVTSIPRKWLTYEALDGLFDVFPGGIRNIWINRNFDELSDKVQLRDKLAKMLESAETDLIRNAKKKQMEMKKKEEKKAGIKKTKQERSQEKAEQQQQAQQMAVGQGVSSGDPHQARTLEEALGEPSDTSLPLQETKSRMIPIPVVGRGVEAIGKGLKGFGQGFTKLGSKLVKDVIDAPKNVNDRIDGINEGGGLMFDGTGESNDDRITRHTSRPWTTREPEAVIPSASSCQPSADAAEASGTAIRIVDPPVQRHDADPFIVKRNDTSSASIDPGVDRLPPTIDISRPSVDSKKVSSRDGKKSHSRKTTPEKIDWTQEFLEPTPNRGWKVWKDSHGITLPSPEPHGKEEDPLEAEGKRNAEEQKKNNTVSGSKLAKIFSNSDETVVEEYPPAFNEEFADDKGMETDPEWKKYLRAKDRDTTRLPLFGCFKWLPFMPSWTFIGKKVDTIYYCRRELARLNVEIEKDQQDPKKYPLMNSAFIQFNHQVAAHMACQSVSHHIPNRMTPRIVEIAPGDVIWDNLSIKWWERFLRIAIVTAIIATLVVAWAIPVSFTSAVSNLQTLSTYKGFTWINKIPKWIVTALSGVLPALMVNVLLAVLPYLLRFAAKEEGAPTGMSVELIVQDMYFAFSFVQLFFVVTISTSIFKVIGEIGNDPTGTVTILADNIPKAANYFFSYLIVQALTTSGSTLAQTVTLLLWFLWRPISDSTARDKFNRQRNLNTVNWGTFFPVYTNLACIGLIYSVISPLIMAFNIITWSVFWVAYRYQTLYVTTFKFDTGGLLFPNAVNQLFTGIYVMELALTGLFFLVRDAQNKVSCYPQAIIMIVCLVCTILYHFLLNYTFKPLYRYMPITLEDDAVARDEEFERIQVKRWGIGSEEDEDIESMLSRKEHEEEEQDQRMEEADAKEIERRRQEHRSSNTPQRGSAAFLESGTDDERNPRRLSDESRLRPESKSPLRHSWADRSRERRLSTSSANDESRSPRPPPPSQRRHRLLPSAIPTLHVGAALNPLRSHGSSGDQGETAGQPGQPLGLLHAKTHDVGDALFGGFTDTIEDLTAAERAKLVQLAFQHFALRARRPVIWIPRDDVGVADDEIRRTEAFCTVRVEGDGAEEKGSIWISNEGTALDAKAKVLFGRAPPDFWEGDLIEL